MDFKDYKELSFIVMGGDYSQHELILIESYADYVRLLDNNSDIKYNSKFFENHNLIAITFHNQFNYKYYHISKSKFMRSRGVFGKDKSQDFRYFWKHS